MEDVPDVPLLVVTDQIEHVLVVGRQVFGHLDKINERLLSDWICDREGSLTWSLVTPDCSL